jgi:transcriptional regulator with XRE-family HTH domain
MRNMNPLARYLKKNGLTAGEFARVSGLGRATIWRIVHDERRPGLYMASEIQRATAGAVKVSAWPVHKRAA